MKKSVYISMSMRFCLEKQFVRKKLEMGIIINESGHFLLSEQYDLIFFQSKEFIFMKKFNCFLMSVLGCHDRKRNRDSLTVFYFIGFDVFTVVFKERFFC